MATTESMKKEILKRAEDAKFSPAQMMNRALGTSKMQELLESSLRENKGAFIASMIDLYSADTTLAKCDPGAVVKEALKAVSLDLTVNKQMGFVWIIPYYSSKLKRYVPTFQLGYKGYIQLCMRSGVYRTINAGAVCEGEKVQSDRMSGLVSITGTATSETAIGYFAYFKTLNGFEKCLYWTRDQVIKHANRYSQSYKSGSEIWTNNFDEMAIKTVLRNLLSHYGLMSVSLVNQLTESGEFEDELRPAAKPEKPDDMIEIDPNTGEVVGGDLGSENEPLPWEREDEIES